MLLSAAVAAVAGAAIVVLLAYGGTGSFPAPIWLLSGAIDGVCMYAVCRAMAWLVSSRLESARPSVRLPALALIFAVGGVAGWLLGTAIGSALLGSPFPTLSRPMVIFGIVMAGVTLLGGFGFYGFEMLTERLAESAVRLKEQEFAARELETAGALQRRLLPPPELAGDGYSVAARHLPARWVAGDFYDVLRGADGTVLLVIADVVGKGMAASLVMASVKATIPFVAAEAAVEEALGRLNERLCSELSAREFVALALARFEPASGRLSLANAGVPDPYLLRAGGAVEELAAPGPRLPLGARRGVTYQALDVRLERGDRLLLVTDGLPEAPVEEREPFGYERLRRTIAVTRGERGAFLEALVQAVTAASAGERADDWTALLLTRS